jgi:D-amino peptidase
MKIILIVLIIGISLMSCQDIIPTHKNNKEGYKVYISADIEGIAGLVNIEETMIAGKEYNYFRQIMTNEVNAAIDGAYKAGAKLVIVRDAHGRNNSIIPDKLDNRALLIRGNSSAIGMMSGIDSTFDAVIFIGYHAKADTWKGICSHTLIPHLQNVSINDKSITESFLNALIAGEAGVPVIFISGDKATCEQTKAFLTNIYSFETKTGLDRELGICKHPNVVCDSISKGVQTALGNLNNFKPFYMQKPYRLVINTGNDEEDNDTPDKTISMISNSIAEVYSQIEHVFDNKECRKK